MTQIHINPTEPITNPEIFAKLVDLRDAVAQQCDLLAYRQRLSQGYSARRQAQIERLQEQHDALTAMLGEYVSPNYSANVVCGVANSVDTLLEIC